LSLLKFGMKKTIFLTFLLFGFVLNSIYCQTKLNFDGKRGDKFEALTDLPRLFYPEKQNIQTIKYFLTKEILHTSTLP
jgi:hypothetical protein